MLFHEIWLLHVLQSVWTAVDVHCPATKAKLMTNHKWPEGTNNHRKDNFTQFTILRNVCF